MSLVAWKMEDFEAAERLNKQALALRPFPPAEKLPRRWRNARKSKAAAWAECLAATKDCGYLVLPHGNRRCCCILPLTDSPQRLLCRTRGR